jgi:amidase
VREVSRTALSEADRADHELAQGLSRGPLHGVPYLLKDNAFTIDGSAATAGARALQGFMPAYPSTVAARLQASGAVLLGKTNMTEFADFVSDVMPSEFSGAGGVVRHPFGLRYDRGLGSSVGSAAAVAARLCAFAIGSETQNSLQAPAVHSAVVAFKPTVGAVSRHGIVPLVPSQDSPGPITHCVQDAALVLQAIAGADLRDTATLLWQTSLTDPPPAAAALQGLRIGVPRQFLADQVLTATRLSAFQRVLTSLTKQGAVIVDPCDLPTAEALHHVRSTVFRTEFKESLDLLLSTLQPNGLASLQDIIRWNSAYPEAIPYGQSLLEAAAATEGVHSPQYRADRQQDVALSLTEGILAALARHSVEVLLVPMAAAAKCTGKAGAPVAALPAGQDAAGAPFGITLFSAPGADRRLLSIALAVEAAIRIPLPGG